MSVAPRSPIAIVVPFFGQGGVMRNALNLAEGLLERGHAAEVWVCRPGSCPFPIPAGIAVTCVNPHDTDDLLGLLAGRLRQDPPKALVAASHAVNLAALRARAEAGVRIPVLVSVHSAPSQLLRGQPRRLARVADELPSYAEAEAIVAVSAGVADDLASLSGLPREGIAVIPNPVVTPGLLALSRHPADHPWLQDGAIPVVLGVGRLAPAKDFGTLIRAFRLVKGVRPARLLILGEGEQRHRLEAQARRLGVAEDVSLPGFVANPFAFMTGAAVAAFSSRLEGFGNALVEAMACGTPVVATDCPSGPAEVLEGGRFGPLVRPQDPSHLASAILALLERPPNREGLIARAAHFGVERSVLAYLDCLGLAS